MNAYEPIAIIGIGCRLPGGVEDGGSYWELLDSARDAISITPDDRWSLQKFYSTGNSRPGKTQSRWGGYVDGLNLFDPQLFGISPREAASIDPQHRLLLEVTYRALEDAGIPVEKVAGQSVSVFVGISSIDYAVAGISFQDRGVLNAYSNTGGSSSIAANRISYCFDLRGPSVAVDTACSSSLVAIHLACESIWRGDAGLALAGGVNALILPDFYVAFSQLGVLSPDGRCKSFAAGANGYVRSEGAGMVLLKPLAAALRDHDPVYSIIRATALNQDGRTPGMTVPSQAAQEALLSAACRKAQVAPASISYVEAHGTGTPVGDPIEARALGAVLGEGRAFEHPCVLGSVKANIGHLEAGAGIASVIKVALALQHRRIPAQLHFDKPNPDIDFERLMLKIPIQAMDWASLGNRRIAGINGFGYGGANAHVIMEEAPPEAVRHELNHTIRPAPVKNLSTVALSTTAQSSLRGADERNGSATKFMAPVVLPLSARSQPALVEFAATLADWLEQNDQTPLAEVASYLAIRRSHHEYRATACATSRAELIEELRELEKSAATINVHEAGNSSTGVAFVCSGQGPQWWAMGRRLLKYSSPFREVIHQCDAELSKHASWSLLDELKRSETDSRLHQTSIAQPAIFAIQVALARVWETWGIVPEILVGHSVGEIAAAYLSGCLDWQDACCVAYHRGRTMDLASSEGAMISVGLSAQQALPWLDGQEHQIALAAINSPHSITLSGDKAAIENLAVRFQQEGIFCRRLQVEYAFHSPQMEPVRDALLDALAHIQPRRPSTPFVSTVTGKFVEDAEVDAEYWWRNVRHGVRFHDAMCTVAGRGVNVALELGPHPVLAYSINESFQALEKSVRTVASLHRQQDDLQCMVGALARLYSLGCYVNWEGFYRRPLRKLAIPNYPFQRQACWCESFESRFTRLNKLVHPLLGERACRPAPQWQQRIDLKLQDYLAHHKVRGTCYYPAAAMIETAIAAAVEIHATNRVRLERLELHNPCLLSDEHPCWITTSYEPETRRLSLDAREGDTDRWLKLATVSLSSDSSEQIAFDDNQRLKLAAIRARCNEEFDGAQLYRFCLEAGLTYGKSFRGLINGRGGAGEALAEVELDATLADSVDSLQFIFHPALLDSCFHAMVASDPSFDLEISGLYLPHAIREIRLLQRPTSRLFVHARLRLKTAKKLVCDLDIYDQDEKLCATIREFESRCVNRVAQPDRTEDLIYRYMWVAKELESQTAPESIPSTATESRVGLEDVQQEARPSFLLFSDEAGLGASLARELRSQGCPVQEVYRSQEPLPDTQDFLVASPDDPDNFDSLFTAALDRAPHLDHIVYLWGCDAVSNDRLSTKQLDDSTRLTTLAPMLLVQAWDRLEEGANTRLTIVTSGAQSSDKELESISAAQAPLLGFGRVIISEFGRLTSKLVDLPACPSDDDIKRLKTELLTCDEEDEIMWRAGCRYVHRFQPQSGETLNEEARRTVRSQLCVGATSASLDELHHRTIKAQSLEAGQVEIEIVTAGLNFSDVMKALNLYPGMPDGPVLLGAECAGRVSRVGPGSKWNVGDEVIAVAPGSFGTHVVANQALVASKPQNLSFEEAAALPIAFLTAEYALSHCARLQSGDSVLIHSASGGVGMAALQLARRMGLKVYATAGSEEKREIVRELGAVRVMDSRSLAFADEILAATDGVGVDAVLNSLPGEAISKGLSILKPGGRFLEIGKRDIHGDTLLGLHPFRNNLAMFAIDLEQLFDNQPEVMGGMLTELVQQFGRHELHIPKIETYAVDEIVRAFRTMQQAKHVGKIVVRYAERPTHVQAGDFDRIELKSEATYWIAGGLGGFGLRVARWMVERGARCLVLGGRSHEIREEALGELEALRARGANVNLIPADITKASDVRAVLNKIAADLPPLRGIVHSAMILDDKLLVDLDESTLQRVLRPKILGSWNLHQETLGLQLDMFVLFSSLSSVFGHAGQANYSAANAMLDSLAVYRRAAGFPATVLNWGHLGEVGYLAEREQLGQRLERQGVLSFSVKQAMDCLEYALQTKAVQLSVLRMDWSIWRGLGITNRVSPRFAHLLSETQNDFSADTAGGLQFPGAAQLKSATPQEQVQVIEHMLFSKLSLLLGIPVDKIPGDRNLLELGLDSLMAVEMRNWMESLLEISFPISSLMGGENLSQLTEFVVRIFRGETVNGKPTVGSDQIKIQETDVISDFQAESLLQQLPTLGSDEVSRLLGQLIREQS